MFGSSSATSAIALASIRATGYQMTPMPPKRGEPDGSPTGTVCSGICSRSPNRLIPSADRIPQNSLRLRLTRPWGAVFHKPAELVEGPPCRCAILTPRYNINAHDVAACPSPAPRWCTHVSCAHMSYTPQTVVYPTVRLKRFGSAIGKPGSAGKKECTN